MPIEKLEIDKEIRKAHSQHGRNLFLLANKINELIDFVNSQSQKEKEWNYCEKHKIRWIGTGCSHCFNEKAEWHSPFDTQDLKEQVSVLAKFLMDNYPTEISEGGAIENVIRILEKRNIPEIPSPDCNEKKGDITK